MASPYPTSIPDLLTAGSTYYLLKDPLPFEVWTALAEHVQALLNTAGPVPQGTKGSIRGRLDSVESALVSLGTTGMVNLRINNDATTPTSKLTVTADVLGIEGLVAQNASVTLDIATTGKNGITFTRAVNTWGYVWAGLKASTLEFAVILDDASTRSAIDVSNASLTGFLNWRRIGARRLNATGSGNFYLAFQQDRRVIYTEANGAAPLRVLSGGASTSYAAPTTALTGLVPPTSRMVSLLELHTIDSGYLKPTFITGDSRIILGPNVTRAIDLPTDSSQGIQYKVSAGLMSLDLVGYEDPI